jgi:hypothetical protein
MQRATAAGAADAPQLATRGKSNKESLLIWQRFVQRLEHQEPKQNGDRSDQHDVKRDLQSRLQDRTSGHAI